jgi:hypothetical protein
MVFARMFVLAIFVPTSSARVISYSRLPNDVDQDFRLLLPGILVFLLLSMVINYFNGCACASSLGIAAQMKIMGDLRWYFQVYGLVSIFSCLQEKTRWCLLDVYLYIVFSPHVRGFPAYLHTCTCIYIWPLAPMEYNLPIPN